MASEPKLILTDSPSDAAQAIIDGGLAQYNEEQAGYRDWRDLAVLVTDHNDEVRGGLLGRTSLGLLFVDLFYLPPEMRRSGIGSPRVRDGGGRSGPPGVHVGCALHDQLPGSRLLFPTRLARSSSDSVSARRHEPSRHE